MASSRRSAKNADRTAPATATVLAALDAALREAALPVVAEPPLVLVAFSGGLDSSVLLHALASRGDRVRLHAVHVHHGLQALAESWPAHCEAVAASLGVSFSCVRLDPRGAAREGLETWARRARYEALAGEAQRLGCELAFTAHHADDQAETVLMRLARGTGVLGLGAMPVVRAWGRRRLVRPLLGLPREALAAYAAANALGWIEDPSNRESGSARNSLRLTVMPALEAAVPGARDNLVRAAALARDAQQVLDEVAGEDLAGARSMAAARLSAEPAPLVALLSAPGRPPALHRQALMTLGGARQRLVLRTWLAQSGVGVPSHAVLAELHKQLLASQATYGEVIRAGAVLRRYRDWLWVDRDDAVPALPAQSAPLPWRGENELLLPDARLVLTPLAGGVSGAMLRNEPVSVRAMPSSARARLRPGGSSRSLKHWHQQLGIPARLRASLPGVFVGDRLVYLAGLGAHHAPGDSAEPTQGWTLAWRPLSPDDPRWPVCALDPAPAAR